MEKIVVILGPTATGKSDLAIKLAKKFNGEIISADSRQVYKGMDIGTGKVSRQEQKIVPHHLLDVVSPKKQFTVAQFKNLAQKKVNQIVKKGKIPFLVGGTAFYIYSVIDDLQLPTTKPNSRLRQELKRKTAAQLFSILRKLDPRRAKNIDKNNPVRLIRAIEIVKSSGQPVPTLKKSKPYRTLIFGLNKSQQLLYQAIDKRVDQRLKQGMVREIKKLLQSGVSHQRLQRIGLTYALVADYLRKKVNYQQMVQLVKTAEQQYTKKQMTWFKKDPRIKWIKNSSQAENLLKKFIHSRG